MQRGQTLWLGDGHDPATPVSMGMRVIRDRTYILCEGRDGRCTSVCATLVRDNGALVLEIAQQHHGEWHLTRLALRDLAHMLDDDREQPE